MASKFSTNELMAVTASRLLQDEENIVVGLGLPQVAALLAKITHAPGLNIVYEIGVVNPESVDPGVGIADPRMWYRSEYFTSFVGTLGNILQKGMIDVGFLGGLQVDKYGNINSTQVKLDDGSIRHISGSGGAADIASFSKKIYSIVKHEKHKIVEAVDYLTTVGYLRGKDSRRECGLPECKSIVLISNLCVMSFNNDAREMQVVSVHPGVTKEDVLKNTGFDITIPSYVKTTAVPTEKELELLRTVVDPLGMYIK